MIAAMYLRKSRAEEQAPVQETLQRHKDTLALYAAANNITVAAIYEEVASGDSLYGRPEMLRLMADLNKYDAVLCMDIDRLGRGAMHEQGLILETIRAAGVLIVTPEKTYNLSDDMDDSLISFKALFAREEYKLIRGRLKKGVLKTIRDGGYVSNAPFGYTKIRIDKCPTLEIDEHEAAAVRMAFDMYCAGHGCQTIADTLNSLGYRPRRSGKFGRTTIAAIIKNPVYTGKIIWNQHTFKRPKRPGDKYVKTLNPETDWLVFEGKHKAIIDTLKYEKANALLDGKYHPPYRKPDELKNPLSGVLYCGNCGRVMTRQPLYNRPYNQPVILCQTSGCCMSSAQNVVEQVFFASLQILLHQMKTYTPVSGTGGVIDYDTVISSAKAEISRLTSQLNNLHDLLEQKVYDIDTFFTRRDDLQTRIKSAEDIIKKTKRAPEPEILLGKLESVLTAYWDGTPSERNRLIKGIVGRAEYIKPKGSPWNTLPAIRVISWAKNL